MRWLIAVALAACACPKQPAGPTGPVAGTGSGSATAPPLTGCESVNAKVQALYRADGQSPEAIADNTAMVMAECAKAPPTVTDCIVGVTTAAQLEATCLPKLDEEGSEADVLVR